jgi:hypothetical protein
MDEWQDIATAPHDGRRILAWGPTPSLAGDYCIVRWVGRFSAEHYDLAAPGWYGEGHDCRMHPLVWQPLPERPTIRRVTAQ